jgi:hypothetical protein
MKKTINVDAIIRRDFASFVGKAFQFKHNGEALGHQPYVDYLCYELSRLVAGEYKKLVINLPPQHLKSFVKATCLSAWTLAQNPATRIIVIACSDKLAQERAFDIREIMQSSWYRRIFPTRLHPDRTSVCDFKTTKGGGVFAASAQSNITGHTASMIIFDDPLDIDDANNLEVIERVNERYDTRTRSRLSNQTMGKLVIVAHRLHELDLSGHVLMEGDWYHVVLPLVAPCCQSYDLGFEVWRARGR